MTHFIPNAHSQIGQRWFVSQSHPNASDENKGTEDEPFLTIDRAARDMSPYDQVVIGEGIYREEITLPVNGNVYSPEWTPVFMASAGVQVTITGADDFNPAWQDDGNGGFTAPLPASLLLPEAYNPFATGMGRLFIDGEEIYEGEDWRLIDDGRSISLTVSPIERRIEVTTRRRCIKPSFSGVVFIAVRGIRVEGAAEPGPFCLGRGRSVRHTEPAGVTVHRSFNLPGASTRCCRTFTGEVGYLSTTSDCLKATVYDDTLPTLEPLEYDVESLDHGLHWNRTSENRKSLNAASEDLFLDEANNLLIRTAVDFIDPPDSPHWLVDGNYQLISELSFDGGKSWQGRTVLDKTLVPFRIHRLDTGEYILPCGHTRMAERDFHQDVVLYKGLLDKDKQAINWERLATVSVTPEESIRGLSEPHVTSFADGRLIMLLRMGAIIPAQGRKGNPSVKFFSTSCDGGNSWTPPAPLTYEDGAVIYSPRSYQDIFRSQKNGRVYAIFNICDEPTTGCDPRNTLHIMEVDPKTTSVKRESMALIEAKHPECHDLIRYSNWVMVESRKTKNPVLMMRASMSEFCPVRHGYDMSSYRYEIDLPSL